MVMTRLLVDGTMKKTLIGRFWETPPQRCGVWCEDCQGSSQEDGNTKWLNSGGDARCGYWMGRRRIHFHSCGRISRARNNFSRPLVAEPKKNNILSKERLKEGQDATHKERKKGEESVRPLRYPSRLGKE